MMGSGLVNRENALKRTLAGIELDTVHPAANADIIILDEAKILPLYFGL